ncbi:hypothetical protein [Glycomyces buryatensis]|uniref:Uncharacterized protein n=1 Tax=Glycomyces buryatensis TaxID=2570927 RepID=A0A4S8QF39_9ACTN|nr:hypothetical protein [Glycomyces buryatensis]THV43028.1 hypothetical protein FAB82_03475 [Glycomyces buryatensis]
MNASFEGDEATGRYVNPRRLPLLKSSPATIRSIADGTQTAMLVSHLAIPWHRRVEPGLRIEVWSTQRTKSVKWWHWTVVEVTAACVHKRGRDIRTCPAAHRPGAIEVNRTGWKQILDHAVLAGERKPLPPGRWTDKVEGGWTFAEVLLLNAGRDRMEPPHQYRNGVERELAEANRRYELLDLTARETGQKRTRDHEELRFRAKSAAYQRKLGHVLEAGGDAGTLAVSEDEIDAELPRIERRARK